MIAPHIRSSSNVKSGRERRRHQRYPIHSDAKLSKCPHCPGLGPIIDISLGGLAFYHENNRESLEITTLDIYFGNDLFCLVNVPCQQVIVDGQSAEMVEGGVTRIGIKFGNLDAKQRKQLNYLLQLNKSFSSSGYPESEEDNFKPLWQTS